MKQGKKLVALLTVSALGASVVMGLAACTPKENNGGTDLAGTYNITVWNSEVEGVSALTQSQIDRFNETNEFGINIVATIEGVSEGESATQMITSVEDGADLFFFVNDQTMRLMQAGALTKLGNAATDTVKSRNGAAGISAATVGDSLYCYPLTEDNGYFMYYNTSIIKEESLGSLEAIIADCEAAGKNFSYELEGSAWYNAGFFFATGCESTWTTDNDGKFVSVKDTFNSDAGVIALRGMQKVLQSSAYVNSSSAADFAAATPSAVVVSGTWDSTTAKNALGENYGVAPLPSFTVEGKSYHLGSYSGSKLLGVKPQMDAKRAAALQQLALYLTNDECQLERFEQFGWGPSNKGAKEDEAVQADAALGALAEQNNYAVAQGQIEGSWWDVAKVYATSAKQAAKDDTAALKAILATYAEALDGILNKSDDVKNAWTLIGHIVSLDTNWDKDIALNKVSDNVWKTKEAIVLAVGDEFKIRKGLSWDDAYPSSNYVITADNAGTFFIQIDTATGDITLVAE